MRFDRLGGLLFSLGNGKGICGGILKISGYVSLGYIF